MPDQTDSSSSSSRYIPVSVWPRSCATHPFLRATSAEYWADSSQVFSCPTLEQKTAFLFAFCVQSARVPTRNEMRQEINPRKRSNACARRRNQNDRRPSKLMLKWTFFLFFHVRNGALSRILLSLLTNLMPRHSKRSTLHSTHFSTHRIRRKRDKEYRIDPRQPRNWQELDRQLSCRQTSL